MNGKIFTMMAALAAVACSRSTPPPPAVPEPYASGAELLEAMQNRYIGRWYRTLTFVQETTEFGADGAPHTTTWYVAAQPPSRLRIDFAPLTAGNGILVIGDSQYVVQGGEITRRLEHTHELMLLGADVYFQQPEETASRLRSLGFDLMRIRQDRWRERDVYVVGATAGGDLQSPQFWVDRELLLLVRLIAPAPSGGRMRDVRLSDYERFGQAWVARSIDMFEDDRMVLKEVVRHVRTNAVLDSVFFDPARFRTARHWFEERR